jgi:hypothetical protein
LNLKNPSIDSPALSFCRQVAKIRRKNKNKKNKQTLMRAPKVFPVTNDLKPVTTHMTYGSKVTSY